MLLKDGRATSSLEKRRFREELSDKSNYVLYKFRNIDKITEYTPNGLRFDDSF